VTTFALVHGAWHDAWCWSRLTPELEALGHTAIAMDLPCDDVEATFDDYADVVVSAIEDCGDDVVVVGHSLAGHTIPLVAAKRPVRHLVFLCSLVPEPGCSLFDQLRSDTDMLVAGYEKGLDGDRWVDRDLARDHMYADCSAEDVRMAWDHLRPQVLAPFIPPFALDSIPDVARTYIVCAQDRLVNPSWSRAVVPKRLGVEAMELPGSHSPFLSRPKDLARLLHAVA
jgi:pimeloyl-ACP methyl ester carboxylesterase